MAKKSKEVAGIELVLASIIKSVSLEEVEQILTREMAGMRIQALLKEDNLSIIISSVIDLAKKDPERVLQAASILGRLGAVARGRTEEVFARINSIFIQTPSSVETLPDGDARYYAAIALSYVQREWLVEYSVSQIIEIDTSEKSRYVFARIALSQSKSLAEFLQVLITAAENKEDSLGHVKARRISESILEAATKWEGEVGQGIGKSLSDWLKKLLSHDVKQASESSLISILNDAFGMLLRVVELRFSNALLADTYSVLMTARTIIDNALWANLHRNTPNLEKVRTCLKEAALVLARQGKTDQGIMTALSSAYYSRSQVQPAIQAHFNQALELDSEIKEWWERAGVAKLRNREVEHEFSNTEDYQIGLLLMVAEESENLVPHIDGAVIPILEMYDLVAADSIKKAMSSLGEMIGFSKQLARMRKLTKMQLIGETLEYEPINQELIGGHRLGVRRVKVERDGVQKVFGGKTKIFIKPRVSETD